MGSIFPELKGENKRWFNKKGKFPQDKPWGLNKTAKQMHPTKQPYRILISYHTKL